MEPHGAHHDSSEHKHPWKPIDLGYRLVVRTVLWVILGAVVLAFAFWWFLT